MTFVQEGVPAIIPAEQCYLGWQQSLMLLSQWSRRKSTSGSPGAPRLFVPVPPAATIKANCPTPCRCARLLRSTLAEVLYRPSLMAGGVTCAHIRNMGEAIARAHWSSQMIDSLQPHFELRFQSLFDSGRGYAFPCDRTGHVDLDSLSERARNNYLFARAMVGRELAVPALRPGDLD
jgi:hypothetical protein